MQSDSWSLRFIVREASKNVFSVHSRLYGVLIFAIVVGVGSPLYSAWESVQLRQQLSEEALAGRGTFIVAAADLMAPVQIQRSSCEALASEPDIVGAGMVNAAGSFDITQIGTNIPVVEASASLIPDLRERDAIVGSALRIRGPGFRLQMPNGYVATARVGVPEPDAIGTNSAITVALPPSVQNGTSCIIRVSELADVRAVASRVIPEIRSVGGALAMTYRFSEPRDPVQVFLARPDRFLPLLLAIAGAIVVGFLNRLRTSEWAAYRMSGTSPRTVILIQGFENIAIAGCFATASGLTSAALCEYFVSPASTVLMGLAAAVGWVFVASVIGTDVALRRPSDLAKDR